MACYVEKIADYGVMGQGGKDSTRTSAGDGLGATPDRGCRRERRLVSARRSPSATGTAGVSLPKHGSRRSLWQPAKGSKPSTVERGSTGPSRVGSARPRSNSRGCSVGTAALRSHLSWTVLRQFQSQTAFQFYYLRVDHQRYTATRFGVPHREPGNPWAFWYFRPAVIPRDLELDLPPRLPRNQSYLCSVRGSSGTGPASPGCRARGRCRAPDRECGGGEQVLVGGGGLRLRAGGRARRIVTIVWSRTG